MGTVEIFFYFTLTDFHRNCQKLGIISKFRFSKKANIYCGFLRIYDLIFRKQKLKLLKNVLLDSDNSKHGLRTSDG